MPGKSKSNKSKSKGVSDARLAYCVKCKKKM